MSDQRTASQEQGAATLNKEQIELIGTILEPRFDKVEDRFDKVIAEMRLIAKEEGEKVRASMDTAVKDLRGEMKEEVEKVRVEMKEEVRQQSKHFYWVIGGLVGIWLTASVTAATLAVTKWPQAVPVAAVAPAAPVAQVAPVGQVAPVAPDLNEPADLSQP